MALIAVRALSYNPVTQVWDTVQGQGAAAFLYDIDAVTQNIMTALKLFQGEWWASLNAGVPYFGQALGQSGSPRQQQVFSLSLQQTILGVLYVTGVTNVQVAFVPKSGAYSFSCVAQTQFGPVTVSSAPGSIG